MEQASSTATTTPHSNFSVLDWISNVQGDALDIRGSSMYDFRLEFLEFGVYIDLLPCHNKGREWVR